MANRQYCVLLADDSQRYLKNGRTLFEAAGLKVITAQTPKDARSELQQSQVDVAVFDIMEDDKNGRPKATWLDVVKDTTFASTPKILISAFPDGHMLALNGINTLPGVRMILLKQTGLQSILAEVTKVLVERAREMPGGNDDKKGRRVFVSHGHDQATTTEVSLFLYELGMQPVVISHGAGSNLTFIELIEKHTRTDFGVVILTPDEVASAYREPKKKTERVRQNVVFEMGYLMALLGRDKVRALRKGQVEVLSNFHGVKYIDMNSERWRIDLAAELADAGITPWQV